MRCREVCDSGVPARPLNVVPHLDTGTCLAVLGLDRAAVFVARHLVCGCFDFAASEPLRRGCFAAKTGLRADPS